MRVNIFIFWVLGVAQSWCQMRTKGVLGRRLWHLFYLPVMEPKGFNRTLEYKKQQAGKAILKRVSRQ